MKVPMCGLSGRSFLGLLRLDPVFELLRKGPSFQKLVVSSAIAETN
jgi:hypothetical protein